jgi:hypothetical protein
MSTTSSRGTCVVWKAATLMAPDFSAWLRQAAARVFERTAGELVIAPGGLRWGHAMISRFVTLATPCGAATAAAPLPPRISRDRMQAGNAHFIFAN